MKQKKQTEWKEQWKMLQDNELFLFKEWILPYKLEDFKDKTVLECGCGGGQHTNFVAPYAKSITAVDLNTIDVARERNKEFENIFYIEDDISTMNLNRQFDIVFSIGVIHHTDKPDDTVRNIIRYISPGGIIIIWVYSLEGNILVKNIVEPLRKVFFSKLAKGTLLYFSKIITALMYIPIYTLYLLPLKFLPYHEYFINFRKLSFYRNTLNVFDKLNAPQVDFINYDRAKSWISEEHFENISITGYKGVSWRISARKK